MGNSNTQLQAVSDELVIGNFTQKHLDIIKSTIAKGTSNEQLQLFIQTCVRTGLDPFLNQIYCIVYNTRDHGPTMSIQIAVEGIVALAKKHPQYKGFIASEVKQEDEFEIDMVTGEPKHRITSMNRGQTVGAYCVAYREGAPNIAVIITRDQVEHLLKGRNSQMWKDYFDDMIVKHAIKRAFKRQYGIEVSEDEFGAAAPSSEERSYERRDITEEVDKATVNQTTVPADESQDEASRLKALKDQVKRNYVKLGLTDPEAMGAHMQQFCKVKGEKPTAAELTAYLKIMEMQIQEKQAAESADDELPI
ncbi:recombination protein RecT [Paenibacillus rhizosphaerae]|uniref:Recombination protein RecT n=1 Tax=Paenibacillus rhizosphaerae TaxID=297318 RepID=A0A839U354_9BACL|nr:RecT family recombinase [Paenibacillus rhizosphaerae]MBB3132160.1 recombination protein RecT [Paenibacillus rhizosphaerae]